MSDFAAPGAQAPGAGVPRLDPSQGPDFGPSPEQGPPDPQEQRWQETVGATREKFLPIVRARMAEAAARNRGASEAELREIMGDEWGMLAFQKYKAEQIGLDSNQVWDGTNLLNQDLVTNRWHTTMKDRFALMEARIRDPAMAAKMDQMKTTHKLLVQQHKFGKAHLLESLQRSNRPEVREELFNRIFPMVAESDYKQWIKDINELNQVMESTGTGVNVFTHPETRDWARGLLATISNKQMGTKQSRKGELKDYSEGGFLQVKPEEKKSWGGWLQPIAGYADARYATPAYMGLKLIRMTMQAGAYAAGWATSAATGRPMESFNLDVPEFEDAFSYTLDEKGRPVYVGGTFGAPEMAGVLIGSAATEKVGKFIETAGFPLVGKFLQKFKSEDAQKAGAFVAAHGRDWMDHFEDEGLLGAINVAGTMLGAVKGFHAMYSLPQGKAVAGTIKLIENMNYKGLAYLASGTKHAERLKKAVGWMAASGYTALKMGMHSGSYERFGQAALAGAIFAPVNMVAGSFGNLFEAAALGGKLRGPAWNFATRSIRGLMENLGIGAFGAATGLPVDPLFMEGSPENGILRDFLQDPSAEHTKAFKDYMTTWAVGGALAGAFFGRAGTRQAIEQHQVREMKRHLAHTPEEFIDSAASNKVFKQEFERKFGYEHKKAVWRGQNRDLVAKLDKATIIEPETLSAYTPVLKKEVMEGLKALSGLFQQEARTIAGAEKAGVRYQPLTRVMEVLGGTASVTPGGEVTLHLPDNLMSRIMRFQVQRAVRLGSEFRNKSGETQFEGWSEHGMMMVQNDKGQWDVQFRKGSQKGGVGYVDGGDFEMYQRMKRGEIDPTQVSFTHAHPFPSDFSDQDIGMFGYNFWNQSPPPGKEYAPQFQVNAEGGFVIRPKGGVRPRPFDPNASSEVFSTILKENLEAGFNGSLGPIMQKYLYTRFGGSLNNAYDAAATMLERRNSGDKSVHTAERPLHDMVEYASYRWHKYLATNHGLEYGFFDPKTLAQKFDEYTATGKFDFRGAVDPMRYIMMRGSKVEQRVAKEAARQFREEKFIGPPLPRGMQKPPYQTRVHAEVPPAPGEAAPGEFPQFQPQQGYNERLAEAGRLESGMQPLATGGDEPPKMTVEEGQAALKKGFEQQKTYWDSVSVFTKYARKVKDSTIEFFQRYFVDKEYRKELAHKLRNTVGYGAKFLTLGPDEDHVKAQGDKMRAIVSLADKNSRILRSSIFRDILGDESLTPKQRQPLMDMVLQYAALKDLESNRYRKTMVQQGTKKDPVTGKDVPNMVEKLEERAMPFDVPYESVVAERTEIEAQLTDAQRAAYVNLRAAMDHAWDTMVERRLVTQDQKLPDYFPRKILDWQEADHPGIGTTLPKQRPSRGYLKGRKGSQRMFDTSMRALLDYFIKVDVQNAKHDFIEHTSSNIHERALSENNLEHVNFQDLTPQEWYRLRDYMEDRGFVLLDTRYGRTGKETLDRDPVVQKLLSDIMVETGMPMMPEVVVGRNYRPSEDKGIFFVTKEYAEFLRHGQTPSRMWQIPALRVMNQFVGKWIKGPMLRGFLGSASVDRASRNMVSDLHGIYLKGDGAKAVMDVLNNLPVAKRIIHAYRTRDIDPSVVEKLTDYEFSILQEMEERGTLQANVRGQEFTRDDAVETEWLDKVMPEQRGALRRMLSKMYRADFKWAKALDDYSENLLRVGYFMRERMERFKTLEKENVGGNLQELSADYAHLRTGEVLVNYNHLTPLERHALNGLVFPFYTWAKSNFFEILAVTAERPLTTAMRAGIASAPLIAWNALMAKDEEERLWHKSPFIAAKPHLILPWIRDSFGNPMVMSWDSTMGEALSFLGMNQLDSDLFQFLAGHGDTAILAKDLVPGMFENAAQKWKNFTAPWIRSLGGQMFSSEFMTPGERAEQIIDIELAQVSRPWSDIQSMLELSKKERSPEEKWVQFAPLVGFPDIFEGVTGEALPQHYMAGRIQRRESQLSQAISNNMRRFTSGMKNQDPDMMQSAIERVWNDMGDELTEAGVEPFHLISRFIERATNQLGREQLIEMGLTPKWLQLTRTQRAELMLKIIERQR